MKAVHYIKTFSKGQMTIPKDIREFFGVGYEFWIKLSIDHGKVFMEPVEEKQDTISREEYRKKLLSIKGDWFDEEDYKNVRKEIEEHFEKNSL